MATDTLKRLAGPVALPSSSATQYTVPAATTTTVVAIHVANESGAQQTFTLSVGTDGAGKRFFYQVGVGANDFFDWSGTLVLNATDVVQAFASASTTLTLTMTGVETA